MSKPMMMLISIENYIGFLCCSADSNLYDFLESCLRNKSEVCQHDWLHIAMGDVGSSLVSHVRVYVRAGGRGNEGKRRKERVRDGRRKDGNFVLISKLLIYFNLLIVITYLFKTIKLLIN